MAFEAGTVDVICPNCEAPSRVPVRVTHVEVWPGVDWGADSRDGSIVVHYANESHSHICRKVH